MKKVAKLVIVDPQNNYLLMYRNQHPTFGDDPDLPGGTVEGSETYVTTSPVSSHATGLLLLLTYEKCQRLFNSRLY